MSDQKDKGPVIFRHWREFVGKIRAVVGGEVAPQDEQFLGIALFKTELLHVTQAPGHDLVQEALRKASDGGKDFTEAESAALNYLVLLGVFNAVKTGAIGHPANADLATQLLTMGLACLTEKQAEKMEEDADRAAAQLVNVSFRQGGPNVN